MRNNGFPSESSCDQSTDAPLHPCCEFSEREEREDTVFTLPYPPPTCSFSSFSLDVNVTFVPSDTFACAAVSGGGKCVFSVWWEKIGPSVCCVILSLALTVSTHALSLWLVTCYLMELHAVCAKWYTAMATWDAFSQKSLLGLPFCSITTTTYEKENYLQNNLFF